MRIILKIAAALIIGLPSLAAAETTTGRTVEALRAANETRSTDAKEQTEWLAEKERLLVLLDAVEQEVRQLEDQRRAHARQVAVLNEQQKSLAPKRNKRNEVEQVLLSRAKALEAELDRIGAGVVPGVVPKTSEAVGPLARFQAAITRLEAAQQNAKSFGVELATGRLDERERAVELLRLGGVAAWWRSLDGKEAGTALKKNGVLLLERAASPAVARAIHEAVDIAKGRGAPRLILLPFDHAKRAP